MTPSGTQAALMHDQVQLRRALLERATDVLHADTRVSGLWLAGSLGRGEGDWLSDVDLVVVAAPGEVEQLVADAGNVISLLGTPALVHEARQNAPASGLQLNVLYDTDPLPLNVDWNFWPPVDTRPSDVAVLFEREKDAFRPGGRFEDELSTMERGEGTPLADRLNTFRLFMTPLVAKHAARGEFEDIDLMFGYMHLRPIQERRFDPVLARLHEVVDDAEEDQPVVAVSATRRYLRTLASVVQY